MDSAEFDRFAEEYDAQHRANIAITGEEPEYFARYKIAELARFVEGRNAPALRILDFGAGIGNSVPFFRAYFPDAELTCADPSERSIDLSRRRFPGNENYTILSGCKIPHDDGAFDVAFSACVFHHIPPDEHLHWMREMRRVVRPDGMITIFEHNPLNPLTVRAVNTCPFDENAILIRAGALKAALERAGWVDVRLRYHLFFPHALRALRPLERRLFWAPIGAQYSATARKT